MLLHERFPVPMYVECDQYGSQARLRVRVSVRVRVRVRVERQLPRAHVCFECDQYGSQARQPLP